jgi:hypothetical protein
MSLGIIASHSNHLSCYVRIKEKNTFTCFSIDIYGSMFLTPYDFLFLLVNSSLYDQFLFDFNIFHMYV